MRTTLTLEDDVAFGLRRIQKSEPNKPFKSIVNEMLRRGLSSPESDNRKTKRFKVQSYPIGLRKDLNFDNIEEVLDILEGPNRK